MLQVIFNEISASEMAAIPQDVQVEIIGAMPISADDLQRLKDSQSAAFGVIERDGRRLYRARAMDYRVYFELAPEGVLVHRVLHKNTIRDFLFRAKLPMAEDEQLGEAPRFWELIEEGRQAKRT